MSYSPKPIEKKNNLSKEEICISQGSDIWSAYQEMTSKGQRSQMWYK